MAAFRRVSPAPIVMPDDDDKAVMTMEMAAGYPEPVLSQGPIGPSHSQPGQAGIGLAKEFVHKIQWKYPSELLGQCIVTVKVEEGEGTPCQARAGILAESISVQSPRPHSWRMPTLVPHPGPGRASWDHEETSPARLQIPSLWGPVHRPQGPFLLLAGSASQSTSPQLWARCPRV